MRIVPVCQVSPLVEVAAPSLDGRDFESFQEKLEHALFLEQEWHSVDGGAVVHGHHLTGFDVAEIRNLALDCFVYWLLTSTDNQVRG
jgi:hypothetical protein